MAGSLARFGFGNGPWPSPIPAGVLLELRPGLAFLGVAWSAGGSQGGEHLLGYLQHGRFLVGAADEEVESGEAEAEEVS